MNSPFSIHFQSIFIQFSSSANSSGDIFCSTSAQLFGSGATGPIRERERALRHSLLLRVNLQMLRPRPKCLDFIISSSI